MHDFVLNRTRKNGKEEEVTIGFGTRSIPPPPPTPPNNERSNKDSLLFLLKKKGKKGKSGGFHSGRGTRGRVILVFNS